MEGMTAMKRTQGRRRKHISNDLKEMRGYWKIKEETLDRYPENSHWKKVWSSRKKNYRMTTIQ